MRIDSQIIMTSKHLARVFLTPVFESSSATTQICSSGLFARRVNTNTHSHTMATHFHWQIKTLSMQITSLCFCLHSILLFCTMFFFRLFALDRRCLFFLLFVSCEPAVAEFVLHFFIYIKIYSIHLYFLRSFYFSLHALKLYFNGTFL